MPRFSKPAVENDQGEIIMPGAFSAAPGGICERRSTFEWDNQNGSGGPLINVDELSVDLSDDDDECDNGEKDNESESCYPGTATTASRTMTTASLGASTVLSQLDAPSQQQHQSSQSDLFGDEEQGLSQCSSIDEQESISQEEQQEQQSVEPPESQYVPQQPDAPVDAYVVERQTSNPDGATTPKPTTIFLGYHRGIWVKITVLIVVLCLGLVMVVSWLKHGPFQKTESSSSDASTSSDNPLFFGPPSPELAYRETLGLQQVIQDILTEEQDDANNTSQNYSLENKLQPNWASPYYQAFYWLLYEDPLQLTLANDDDEDTSNDAGNNTATKRATIDASTRVQQRFTMAAFYFATSQPYALSGHRIHPNVWKHCGAPKPPPIVPVPSRQQQKKLNMQCTHEELKNVNPRKYSSHPASSRWLSSVSECDWAGVTCNDEGYIISIDLADYGMHGYLLEELTVALKYLQVLSLPFNENLMGRIPSRLLRRVKRLELQYNNHDGVLFDPLNTDNDGEEESDRPLEILNLAGNRLTGDLNSELGLFGNISQVFLDHNQLTGSLPPHVFASWPNLDRLRLGHNCFEGNIPSTLFTSQALLRELDLSGNEALTGSIPSQVGALGDTLRTLGLANMQLEGTLPLEFYDLTKLAVLDLQNNTLSGTVGTEIGQLNKIHELYVQNNWLEGQLPSELGNLANILNFHIDGNDFKGIIPLEFCELGPEDLPLAFTVDVVADCTPEDNTDDSLQCPNGCCSTCCQKSSGECTLDASAILGIKNMNLRHGENR